MSLVDTCEARAGARYIAGLKEPEGMKAALGTRCHAITAEYLSKGTAPNRAETFEIPKRGGKPTVFYPGRIVWNVLTHLPPAGTVPNVERKISLNWGGIQFHRESSIDMDLDTGFGDHKFTTSLEYAKTPAELRTDTQRVIYSADWFQRHDADELIGQWTYGQFDCKGSRKVLVPATRKEIATLMSEVIVPKAEKLLGWIAKGVDWRTLPKNTNMCGKFPPFGCPYASQCPRTKDEKRQMVRSALGFTQSEKKVQIGMSSFMEKLRAKKAQAGVANTNASPEPVSALAAKVEETPSDDIEHDAEDAAAAIVGAINPPGEAGDVLDAPDDESESAADIDQSMERSMVGTKAQQAADEPADVGHKKRRGRPAGTKNKPKTNLEKQLEASLVPDSQAAMSAYVAPTLKGVEQTGEAEYLEQAAADGGKPITLLLVDCFIARGAGLLNEAIYASDLIAQAHGHIKETYHVLDYRSGGAPELEFGKGPGLLAACIEGLIQDLPAGCVVVLDTRSPEGQVALQPLVAASISVVRGAA